jgi:hypothetical protein
MSKRPPKPLGVASSPRHKRKRQVERKQIGIRSIYKALSALTIGEQQPEHFEEFQQQVARSLRLRLKDRIAKGGLGQTPSAHW